MLKAALFDLDGTLLDIHLDAFLGDYFRAIAPVLSEITGLRPVDALDALKIATDAMCTEHGFPSNREAFNDRFAGITGIRLSDPEPASAVTRFYKDVFPTLGDRWSARTGAREVVDAVRSAGLVVAVATNPIFPRAATVARLGWAGFDPGEFALVTTYENSASSKPHASYYEDIAASLQLACDECLMVGDDERMDLAAARTGMATYHVSDNPSSYADSGGCLSGVMQLVSQMTV